MLRYLLEKEFKQIRRDRFMPKIIFIIPIMQLIILPFAANFEMRNINLSIVDNDHSVTSMQLVDKVLSSGYFRLTDRSDRYDEALTSVESNESDIILEIPSDFERDLGKEGRADVMIAANAVNGTKGGLGSSYLSSIIQDFNREKGFASMGSGRGVASINLFNPHLSYKIYMVPGIMVFSPVPKSLFLLSKLIPFWVIGFVLLTVAILIAWLIYGLVPEGSFGVIYLFAAVYLIAFTGFGLAISSFSSTQQQAMLTAFFFLIIFALLSGLFTPISSMPEWAQKITLANPVRYFVEVMRMVYLKGSGFADLRGHFVIVCLFAVFFNLLAVISYRKKG